MVGVLGKRAVPKDRKVLVFDISNLGIQPTTAKQCTVCCGVATQCVFRANMAGVGDHSSRRWACKDHATVEDLYPARFMSGRVHYRRRRGRRGYGDGFGRTTMPTAGKYSEAQRLEMAKKA